MKIKQFGLLINVHLMTALRPRCSMRECGWRVGDSTSRKRVIEVNGSNSCFDLLAIPGIFSGCRRHKHEYRGTRAYFVRGRRRYHRSLNVVSRITKWQSVKTLTGLNIFFFFLNVEVTREVGRSRVHSRNCLPTGGQRAYYDRCSATTKMYLLIF